MHNAPGLGLLLMKSFYLLAGFSGFGIEEERRNYKGNAPTAILKMIPRLKMEMNFVKTASSETG